jgi:GT2 family glycosyltransferase
MDVSVLVISYNTRELTARCVGSVYRHTRGVSFELIVWDNASCDGSADAISRQFPDVRLIRSERNVGFAVANNRAASVARGEFVLLLNSDTELLGDSIAHAVRLARSPGGIADQLVGDHHRAGGADIVGGRTYFADGRLNHTSCHGAPTLWSVLCQGTGLSSVFRRSRWLDPESLGRWPRDTARVVDAVTGCFMLVRRSLWERLGGFDESFFMYGEDTDLCLRARKLGSVCVVCPQATLVHHGGASDRVRPDKMVRLLRAKAQLLRKHWPPSRARVGTALLACWPLTRWMAFSAASLLRREFDTSRHQWKQIWQRRAEFQGA